MSRVSPTNGATRAIDSRWLIGAAVAAAISANFASTAIAAEPAAPADDSRIEEVQITGSRIVRRDTETTSPLITVDKETLEKSAYISIEQALNEMPEFMAGGALFSGLAVTSLTEAGNVAGGSGSGNMFDTARGIDNARMGTFTPGQATVNLRGLGPNRSLTLIDGRRGIAANASGTLDLNSVPQIALGNIEVITGGASSVYGADALAGVTNLKTRTNFDGVEVRARGGINEYGGDGKEWQISTLMGTTVADNRGHVMLAMDYSKREIALWANRPYFRDAMVSNLSNSGDYLFPLQPAYSPFTAGGGTLGSNTVFNNAWSGNFPAQSAINNVFSDRTCAGVNCITTGTTGIAFYFNPDGTLFTRQSNIGTTQYGPQSYNGGVGGTPEQPNEVVCQYAAGQRNTVAGFQEACTPQLSTVDYGRRLTSPREAYTLFANGDYEINDHVTAYSQIQFANSHTETRREPSPASGNWTISIPYHSDPNVKYLPSIAQTPSPGVAVGDTLPEYRSGGSRGLNCAPTGGCTMQQAFPVTPELATLLNSRAGTAAVSSGPFAGQPGSACELRAIDSNAGVGTHVVQVPAAGGRPAYTVQMDPNTGETFKTCGPNSAWRLATQLTFLPPRGTVNDLTTYQLVSGIRGDLFVSDWTYDMYVSQGESRTRTEYQGYVSMANYAMITSAPNFGRGFTAQSNGVSNKRLSCTSGFNPFQQAAGTQQVSQDCIDAISSNQTDRESMRQFEAALNLQGGLFELPGGEVRTAVGVDWRKNTYAFTPDSMRESDYILDTTPGQFGVGHVEGSVAVKEIYGEVLIPLLKDIPVVRALDLELGYRFSSYTTGQDVPTYKAQLSWAPLDWVRVRGGYNRAERTPNIAELYTTTTVSSQLSGVGSDPCRSDVQNTYPTQSNNANNPNRAQLQALCSAQINSWGANGQSTFHANPNTFTGAGGVLTFQGNPNLESEQGDTWTAGVVLQSPFQSVLAQNITATIDWYRAKITDPIDVVSGQLIVEACFNVNGSNPTYSLNDPTGYCKLIERDPASGGIRTINAIYDNIGELGVEGVDTTVRWAAALDDMGMSLPGRLSATVSANFLISQDQPVTVGGEVLNYAGYVGASKLRTNTTIGYNVNDYRASVTWLFHKGTEGLNANRPSDLVAGYPSGSLFNVNMGAKFGFLDVGVSVSNVLNTSPKRAGYFLADTTGGYGTFDPYGDLVGRRYSLSLTASF